MVEVVVKKSARKSQAKVSSRDRERSATAFRDVESVQRLMGELDSPWAYLVANLCYWGCGRVDAVLHLRGKDLLNGQIVYRRQFSKTDKSHAVPIHSELQIILNDYGELPMGWLFPARQGNKARKQYRQHWVTEDGISEAIAKGWSQGNQTRHSRDRGSLIRFTEAADGSIREVRSAQAFNQSVKRAADKLIAAGEEKYHGCSSHTFRRSMCSWLYFTKGFNLKQIQAISGHRSIDALQHYLELDTADTRAAFVELVV